MITRFSELVQTRYHVTPVKNLKQILKQGLVPQIGTRSELLGEPQPAIFLFRSILDAEEALMNWLGDEFEDEPLALLKVNLPLDLAHKEQDFETQVFEKIPPQNIWFLKEL